MIVPGSVLTVRETVFKPSCVCGIKRNRNKKYEINEKDWFVSYSFVCFVFLFSPDWDIALESSRFIVKREVLPRVTINPLDIESCFADWDIFHPLFDLASRSFPQPSADTRLTAVICQGDIFKAAEFI